MKRREFLAAVPASVVLSQVGIAKPVPVKKGVMMMNRIAPSVSELYIAAADGTGERKVLAESAYDYNAAISRDGARIVFTSERLGDGNSSLFTAKGDGTGVKVLQGGPSVDDAAAISPDGKWLAFVSTRDGYKANIWVMNLASGKLKPDRAAAAFHRVGRELHVDAFDELLAAQVPANGWERRFLISLEREAAAVRQQLAGKLAAGGAELIERNRERIDRIGDALGTVKQLGAHGLVPLFLILEDYRALV